jgi:hypothetical protein
MLSNSIIAGGLASGYLTVLMLQVNPEYPLSPSALAPLFVIVGAAYGANLTVVFYTLIVLRQILAVEVLSPGWLSVRLLSWLFTIAAAGGATVMWLNLRGFGPVLDAETTRSFASGAVVVSAAGAVFLTIALAHVGRRGGWVSATTLVLTAALSVAIPAALRGPGHAAPVPSPIAAFTPAFESPASSGHGRLTMILLDGASLDVIAPAVAEGRLPNLGRIFDRGAVRHLATLRPTQAEPVWSAAATGRLPMWNGVRSAATYRAPGTDRSLSVLPDYCFAQALVRFGFLVEERHSSAALTARPLWRILSDQGVSVGIIGWPLTDPATPVSGLLVSEAFHRLTTEELDLEGTATVWPAALLDEARAARDVDPDPDPAPLVSMLGRPPAGAYDLAGDPAPVAADRVHVQLLQSLDLASVRFLAVRLPGIDAIGHQFLRYANPIPFGDVSEEERRRLGGVLERYYGFIDAVSGHLLDALGPDDVLMVVSAFGMEPLSPGKRVLERLVGNPEISGTHERAPDGFVLAYGGPVQPGRPPRSSVVDLTPTILYFFGLPVGRDMEGFARTDLFTTRFTEARPVAYIPSYGR